MYCSRQSLTILCNFQISDGISPGVIVSIALAVMIFILIVVLLALCVYYVRINRMNAVTKNDIVLQPQVLVSAQQYFF